MAPSMSALVCITDQGSGLGKSLWAPHPFLCHALRTGVSSEGRIAQALESFISHQPHQAPADSAPWWGTWEVQLLPADVRRTPKPSASCPGSCCQPLPGGSVTRDMSVLPLLCAPHKGLVATQPGASPVTHCNDLEICLIQQQHTMVMLEARFSY